ncbi:unnamed protein product [Cylicostephanus goldi]|uniref:Uncharacterized protein n=1 Tax=Cylicostephanus goldi TaxID=71465 RepID=A0A3P6RHW6_CYLGO|nr:unnamed protein product [Cylicostephanus goldi]
MLKGQHQVHGGFDGKLNWFYFDEVTGGVYYGWKYIDYQDKTCYYGPDGAMYKGWCVVGNRRYYFDETTGAQH